jgi:hypothetical protein
MAGVTECRKWFVQEQYSHGRCVSTFQPDDGNPSCPICVGPELIYGTCSGCVSSPPHTYVATLTIDGNGIAGGTPDYGCGIASYSGEFLLYYGPSNCIWSSAELELNCSSSNGTGTSPVTCVPATGLGVRSRVTMQVTSLTVSGTPRTVFLITANWRGGTENNPLQQSSVTSRGIASKIDCFEAIDDAPYFARDINIGTSLTWANPYVNSSGAGAQIQMTASIRPLMP